MTLGFMVAAVVLVDMDDDGGAPVDGDVEYCTALYSSWPSSTNSLRLS
jgi:hypothetical protein